MSDYESLFAPISEDNPCGEDISYLPEFLELDTLIEGKAETQFSEAVKPEWKVIARRCVDLFKISKHLQVATVLCVASLETKGLVGAADAAELLSKLLREYWESIYPRLDPDDKFDPLERMNIIGSLASPMGTFGDNYRFIERLAEAPLTNSPQLGRLSYSEVRREAGTDGTDAANEQLAHEAAFRDTPPDELDAIANAIERLIGAFKDINTFLNSVPGSDKAPNFDQVMRQLAELSKAVAPYLAKPPEAAAPAGASGSASTSDPSTPSGAAPGRSVPGTIQNRSDVVAAIDRICEFYSRAEPSSPVPLMLQRAKRLVNSDFMSIMSDIAPDSLTNLKNLVGLADKTEKDAKK